LETWLVVCFSSLSKLSSSMDMDMMTITHAVDRKRKAEMLDQHQALRMLASDNNNQTDQEHSHAMSTAQDTVSQ
jgi:hypothetical protein